MNRIVGIDYLRGISAIMIIMYHYTYRYSEMRVGSPDYIEWNYTLSWGCMAVITFFMISGYLTDRQVRRGDSAKQFLFKRAKRLYPTYWCGMIITTLCCYILKHEVTTFRQFLLNLTMVPAIFGERTIDGVYWTLQFELCFYVVFVLFILNKNVRFVKYFVSVWIALTIPFYFYQHENVNLFVRFLRVFAMPEYNSVFVLGIMLNWEGDYIVRVTQVLSVINFYLWHSMTQTFFMLVVFFLLFLIINYPQSVLNKESKYLRPIIFVASISYPLYLIHQRLGMSIISEIVVNFGWTNEIILIIPVAISVFLAYLLHNFIEIRS